MRLIWIDVEMAWVEMTYHVHCDPKNLNDVDDAQVILSDYCDAPIAVDPVILDPSVGDFE